MRTKYKCRLCGSDNLNNIITLEDFPKAAQFFLDSLDHISDDNPIELLVTQCNLCNLVQLQNEPVEYYKEVITAASLSNNSKITLAKEWQPFIEKFKLKGKLALEVGSGRGDFLQVLRLVGMQSIGLEYSKISAQDSKNKGLSTIQGYLLDKSASEIGQYSLVVCNNFLEHQPDTRRFINQIHSILDPDGIVYISVPNLEYLLSRHCLYEFVVDHLVYFTEESLRLAFEMNGFEILEQYKKNNNNDLVLIARRRKLLNLDLAKNEVKAVIESLKLAIHKEKNQGGTVAIWGAGHRALALMAMANTNEIDYVVDSADFKQNKYTPILHKKIISPNDFINKKCDLLIIMLPGSYSSQVVDFLKLKKIKCKTLKFEDKILDGFAIKGVTI